MPRSKTTTSKSPRRNKAAASGPAALIPERIAPLVLFIRHEKVLLDSDLAGLYGVASKVLNQAVKRNAGRFPEDFMFRLSRTELEEVEALRSQIAISKTGGVSLRSQSVTLETDGPASGPPISKRGRHRKYLPYAFTEQGVAMLSSVLRSPRAVEVNIAIMRTFVQLRRLMDSNRDLARKIESLEKKYAEHDHNFQIIFDAIKKLIQADEHVRAQPKRRIGFHDES